MKKAIRFCLTLCLFATFGWNGLQASNTLPTTPLTTERTMADPRTQEMTRRLEEINAMDKSQLSASERKALRKEVREIKKARNSGGIYLSAGAIIIILLILILVL